MTSSSNISAGVKCFSCKAWIRCSKNDDLISTRLVWHMRWDGVTHVLLTSKVRERVRDIVFFQAQLDFQNEIWLKCFSLSLFSSFSFSLFRSGIEMMKPFLSGLKNFFEKFENSFLWVQRMSADHFAFSKEEKNSEKLRPRYGFFYKAIIVRPLWKNLSVIRTGF